MRGPICHSVYMGVKYSHLVTLNDNKSHKTEKRPPNHGDYYPTTTTPQRNWTVAKDWVRVRTYY